MSETTIPRESVVQLRLDVRRLLERRLVEAVEAVLEEELQLALGAGSYERTARRAGYRHGGERLRITTAAGTRELRVSRGRVAAPDGRTVEFHSQMLPRYSRRTREVDEAILGVYLAGANSRRICRPWSRFWVRSTCRRVRSRGSLVGSRSCLRAGSSGT